ncbi:MAG: hypothetical protein Q8M24_11130 [Pseudolabrys sp.]|nr:hypothetical protein [Pseudolabrys sp.]MDP2295999.1 hypothetical protein [Pseudolabrys sp.]
MTEDWKDRVRPYAGWAALVLLVAGLFGSVVAANFAFPLVLLFGSAAFAVFRFWHELKTFDFWALDEWARMRYDAAGVRDWHAPHHAAEMYCSQVVVRTRNEAAAEMNIIMMELIRGREKAGGTSISFADANSRSSDRTERNEKYDAAQVRYNQCNTALARELLTYLVRGDLLAKGLPTKEDVAHSERIIPTSRWRIMNLDIAKAKANGLGWHYTGVVIGVKPKPRKPAKPAAPQAKPVDATDKPAVRIPQAPRPDLPPRPPRP